MTYELLLARSAQRELDDLPREAFRLVDPAVWALRDTPRPFGVKKLDRDIHRARIGPWRVVYAIRDQERQVVILRIARRSERTYRRLPEH